MHTGDRSHPILREMGKAIQAEAKKGLAAAQKTALEQARFRVGGYECCWLTLRTA